MATRKRPERTGRHRVDESGSKTGQHVPVPSPMTHNPDDPHEKRGEVRANKRRGPKHYAPEPKRARVAKTAPVSAAPSSSPPTRPISSPPTRPAARQAGARSERVGQEARYLAQQAAIRATTGKPTVTGRAAAGAASGAAVGTALGGPVGTAVGGGLGAVVGGVSGASAKKAYKAAMRPYPGARRALVAEFAVCAVVIALSPLDREQKPGTWMRRMTAVMGMFFILGLVSTAGRWGARAAAGFGGVVTVALVISERQLFGTLAGTISSKRDTPAEFGSAPDVAGDSGGQVKTGGIDDLQPAEG